MTLEDIEYMIGRARHSYDKYCIDAAEIAIGIAREGLGRIPKVERSHPDYRRVALMYGECIKDLDVRPRPQEMRGYKF